MQKIFTPKGILFLYFSFILSIACSSANPVIASGNIIPASTENDFISFQDNKMAEKNGCSKYNNSIATLKRSKNIKITTINPNPVING